MGGDMTGKAMVPIVAERAAGSSSCRASATLTTEDEVKAMEKRISDRGYYPVRLTPRRGRRVVGRPGARRYALQGRDARHGRALDGARRRAARRAPASAASSRRPTTTCSRSTRSSRPPSIVELGEATRSRSTGSRWSRPAGPTRRRGTRSASCPSRSSASGSTGSSPRSPIRTGRSSISTPRRTARTLTTRRSSTQT